MSTVVAGVGASHTTLMNTKWAEVDHLDRAHAYRDALGTARASGRRRRRRRRHRHRPQPLPRGLARPHADVHGRRRRGHRRRRARHARRDRSRPTRLARPLLAALVGAGFDPRFSARLQVDHGITHAIQYVLPAGLPVVPLVVNCFAPPLPPLARCAALGAAVATALAARRPRSAGRRRRLRRAVAPPAVPGLAGPQSDDDEFLVASWLDGRGNWSDYEGAPPPDHHAAPPVLNERFDDDVLDHLDAGTMAELVGGGRRSGRRRRQRRQRGAQVGRHGGRMRLGPGRRLCYSPMPEWLTGMAVALIDQPIPKEQPMTAWLDLLSTRSASTRRRRRHPHARAARRRRPDVVFLHGTSGHLEAFTRNVTAHVEAGFRVHAIDMLGHGYTDKPRYPYEIPRYVDHLADYLDAVRHRAGQLGRRVARRLGRRMVRLRRPGAGHQPATDRRRRHEGQPRGDGAHPHVDDAVP